MLLHHAQQIWLQRYVSMHQSIKRYFVKRKVKIKNKKADLVSLFMNK